MLIYWRYKSVFNKANTR